MPAPFCKNSFPPAQNNRGAVTQGCYRANSDHKTTLFSEMRTIRVIKPDLQFVLVWGIGT
jgi:hypothetical protein